MNISSINSISNNRNMYRSYQKLSSGKRINSAKDDAAGLAIAKKLNTQVIGSNVGVRNAKTSQDMVNVADGGLSSVTDQLQRIRELGIQASNGLYSDSDRSAIQAEIDQLKQSIGGVTSTTQFNTMKLLDGSMGRSHVAAKPDGSGMDLDMPRFSLEALGIADFDVTSGDFDVSVIDDAIEKVSSSRSYLGAASNSLDHMMAYSSNAAYNMTAAQSRIEDLDYARGITDLKKEQALNTYSLMMQKKMFENQDGRVMLMFGN